VRVTSMNVGWLFAVAVAWLAVGCHGSTNADCSNGTCGCERGSTCEFSCDSPPCHVDCLPGSSCSAACADGTCTCEEGAACSFVCNTGPCHVTCVGDNGFCSGECWDGQCDCGSGSTCSFRCDSPPCHTTCDLGSSCVLDCLPNGAGGPSCDIVSCATGSPTLCPGGEFVTCNADCPHP
jgi:hypothetical protein